MLTFNKPCNKRGNFEHIFSFVTRSGSYKEAKHNGFYSINFCTIRHK